MLTGSEMQQTKIRGVKYQMKNGILISIAAFYWVSFLAACSPRIYRPPALGAEYQFDRGMPAAKHPSTLFDKKMNKDLEEEGILQKNSSGSTASAPATKLDSSAKSKTIIADTSRTDSLTTPVPAKSPEWPDSSHNGKN